MKKNKYVTESFINAITKEVSILIAANDHMSIEKAEILFKKRFYHCRSVRYGVFNIQP